MFAQATKTLMILSVTSSMALAQAGGDGNQALIDWARSYQQRAQAICGQVCAPSRSEAESRIEETLRQRTTDEHRRRETELDTLSMIAQSAGPHRTVVQAWGLPLEEEVTRRHARLLRAWDQYQQDRFDQRVVTASVCQSRRLNEAIASYQKQILQDEARLARMQRACREGLLKKAARQYATNWLLGGHPEKYVPAAWTHAARRSRKPNTGPAAQLAACAPSDREFKALRDDINHLTEVLVAVGLGEFGPDYVTQVERQLQQTRCQAQAVMAALTGTELSGGNVRLVADRSTDQCLGQ